MHNEQKCLASSDEPCIDWESSNVGSVLILMRLGLNGLRGRGRLPPPLHTKSNISSSLLWLETILPVDDWTAAVGWADAISTLVGFNGCWAMAAE